MTIALENEHWTNFIAGEPAAFRALYEGYSDKLYAYGCRYTTDTELVMDCLHDLFVDLHRYRRNLDPQTRVTAYLFSSLRRKIHASLLKHQRYKMLGDTTLENELFLVEWNAESQLIQDEEDAQLTAHVAQALSSLPQRQQEALYLRFSEGMPYTDLATVLGVSVPSCRTLVYRAIKSLRNTMEEAPLSPFLMLLFRKS